MSQLPPDAPGQVVDEAEETFCYGHPKTATRLRCSRCDRPICGRCAIPASVGQHCPECVAEARRSSRKVRSTQMAKAPATVAIVVICVAFYFAQRLSPSLTQQLASFQPAIAAGQWYRLFTPIVLHAPNFIFHILFNMYVLWSYGPDVEQGFGTVRFVSLFVITGFVGNAVSYAFGPCPTLGVGASGAIFGVIGALAVFLYNRRRSSFVAHYLRSLLVLIGINLVLGFLVPGIDNLAHIGGLASGAMLGAGFDRKAQTGRITGSQILAAVAVAGLGVALVAWRTSGFTC